MRIEESLRAFSNLDPIRTSRRKGENILGVFRANFAQLKLRIDNHFDPPEETCTEGIFQELYKQLTTEQQMIIQWQQYAPERAKAIYRIPFEDIDLTRQDYAILTIQKNAPKQESSILVLYR